MDAEFRTFVEQTEKQLLILFHSIDRDNNGKLDKGELESAFKKAGLVVPRRKLDAFFDDIDWNKDGFITFGEWRYVFTFKSARHSGQAVAPLNSLVDRLTGQGAWRCCPAASLGSTPESARLTIESRHSQ